MFSIEKLTQLALDTNTTPEQVVKSTFENVSTDDLCCYAVALLDADSIFRKTVEQVFADRVSIETRKIGFQRMIEDIRNGKNLEKYPVGKRFEVLDSLTGKVNRWVIAKQIKRENGATALYVLMDHVLSDENGNVIRVPFDDREALFYAKDGLPAGTYHYRYSDGNYCFTIKHDIPAGGQIVHGIAYGDMLRTYTSPYEKDPIESVDVINDCAGKYLGEIMHAEDAKDSPDYMNCAARVWGGSNDYEQAFIRQWLNGEDWKPASVFDRPPVCAEAPFTAHLPEYFKEVVISFPFQNCTNNIFANRSYPDLTIRDMDKQYTLCDKFFLPSISEIGAEYTDDGTVLDLFKDGKRTDRIRKDLNGGSCWYWLRSPIPNWAESVRGVYTDGDADFSSVAYFPDAVAPACVIG